MPRPPVLPDPTPHSQKLLQLIGLEVKKEFVYHLADSVVDAVDTASRRKPTAIARDFKRFAWNFIRNTPLGMPTLLVALVYITRAKPHRIRRNEWVSEYKGLFMGALIVALKYTADDVPRTIKWVRAIPGEVVLIGKLDVNRMEREFLAVLNWELGFTEEDILLHHPTIVELYGLT